MKDLKRLLLYFVIIVFNKPKQKSKLELRPPIFWEQEEHRILKSSLKGVGPNARDFPTGQGFHMRLCPYPSLDLLLFNGDK